VQLSPLKSLAGADRVVFNRIPKSGSSAMREVILRLSERMDLDSTFLPFQYYSSENYHEPFLDKEKQVD
jgi:hypothetical protein